MSVKFVDRVRVFIAVKIKLLKDKALEAAIERDKALSQTLSINFADMMGISAGDDYAEDGSNHGKTKTKLFARNKIFMDFKDTLQSVMQTAMESLDAAADQHIKRFICSRLPVYISPAEEMRTSAGRPDVRIFPFTCLRLVRPNIARVLVEDGMVVVYHCLDNPRDGTNMFIPLEFDLDDGPTIETLLGAYPAGLVLDSLPHPSEELEDKISIAQSLYKEGILYIVDEATLPYDNERANDNISDDYDDDPF